MEYTENDLHFKCEPKLINLIYGLENCESHVLTAYLNHTVAHDLDGNWKKCSLTMFGHGT